MDPNNRKLTTHQKAVLIQVLRTFPGERVQIVYSSSAGDGRAFATDFMAIFKAIGWDVSGPEPADNFAGGSIGLALAVADNGTLPACVEALQDALRIYEIEIETRPDKRRNIAASGFVLWVGPDRQQV